MAAVPSEPPAPPEANEAVAAVAESAAASEEPPSWPDESAESAFLAEARERGEVVQPAVATVAAEEPVDPKALPPLDDLVNRIPAEVREVLEDLFRARFVTVKRVPKRALKPTAS